MDGERAQWFGPGETARRLGVTTKALRVYEREGLVVPHRAESGWRLYGPAHLARLHQIIVLRDLGLPLKSIKTLMGSQSRLRDVLRLQRESLQAQQVRIGRAIALIETAQRQLDGGHDLSLDDLATLTRETVVQQPISVKEFETRLEALVAEKDPTGQASRAVEEMKSGLRSSDPETMKSEWKALMAEAQRLKEAGDVESEAAKQLVRRWRARAAEAGVKRPAEAQREVIRAAYDQALAETQAQSQTLPFDPAALAFLQEVRKGMKERGELD
jgi:DNA-binding transcriptional MerR regulator